MALTGKQWEHTYWHDDKGEVETHRTNDLRWAAESENTQVPTRSEQGMLFDPYTATGLPKDPLVSPKQRTSRIKEALDIQGNAGTKKVVLDQMSSLDMPIHEFTRPEGGKSRLKVRVANLRAGLGGAYYSGNPPAIAAAPQKVESSYKPRTMSRPTSDAVSEGAEWNSNWYSKLAENVKGRMEPGYHEGEYHDSLPNKRNFADDYLQAATFRHPDTGHEVSVTDEKIAHKYVGKRGESGESEAGFSDKGMSEIRKAAGLGDGYDMSPYHDDVETLYHLNERGYESNLFSGSGKAKRGSIYVQDEQFGGDTNRHEVDVPQDPRLVKRGAAPMTRGMRSVEAPTPQAEPYIIGDAIESEDFVKSERTGDWRRTKYEWHTRDKTSDLEESTVYTQSEVYHPSQSTLSHEYGHARDPNVDLSGNFGALPYEQSTRHYDIDPVKEGVADGTRDRQVTYADKLNRELDPQHNPKRHEDLSGTGYSTKSKHWGEQYWHTASEQDEATDTMAALYGASRIVQGLTDKTDAIPDRFDLWNAPAGPRRQKEVRRAISDTITATDKVDEGTHIVGGYEGRRKMDEMPYKERLGTVKKLDTHLLGHLYDEHESVRHGLDQLGMGEAGKNAQSEYLGRLEAMKSERNERSGSPEQGTLNE